MDSESVSALDEGVTRREWERTPASVRRLLRYLCEDLLERVAALEQGEVLRLMDRDAVRRMAAGAGGGGAPRVPVCCSFCGECEREGVRLVSGVSALICAGCVATCHEVLSDG